MASNFETHYKRYKEVYIVILTFLLSGFFGSLLTNHWENNRAETVKYENDLQYARQEGRGTMDMVNRIISERHMNAINYIAAIQNKKDNNLPQADFDAARSKYLTSKDNWNYDWNLMRVKLKNNFSDELANDFYNYDNDAALEKQKIPIPCIGKICPLPESSEHCMML